MRRRPQHGDRRAPAGEPDEAAPGAMRVDGDAETDDGAEAEDGRRLGHARAPPVHAFQKRGRGVVVAPEPIINSL